MGVSYEANYGIGFQLNTKQLREKALEKCEGDIGLYLDNIVTPGIDWFQVGEGFYSGEDNDYFLEIVNPFSEGIEGLYDKREELFQVINCHGLEFSEFGLMGGLYVH